MFKKKYSFVFYLLQNKLLFTLESITAICCVLIHSNAITYEKRK